MEDITPINRSILVIIPVFGCLASMVSGYFIVYFTMLDDYIQKYHAFTDDQNDWYFSIMTAALPVGAFLGAFIYNAFIEANGQNKAMKILDIIAIVAVVMQVVSIYLPVVIVSRLLMGFYCAITTGVIPSWILSMSPSFTSGIFGTLSQFAIALGMGTAYCMGQFLEEHAMGQNIKVRIYIGMPILTSLVHLIGLNSRFGFDNIQRLIEKRDHNEVIRFMKLIYGKKWKKYQKEVRNFKMLPVEIPVIKEASEEEEQSQSDAKKAAEGKDEQPPPKTIIDWEKLKKKVKKIKCNQIQSIALAIMLAVASQASGIVAILQYAKQLFVKLEEDVVDADSTILILGFFQVLATLISGCFINRFGRRPMMLIGQSIIVVSLFACMVSTMLVERHQILTTVFIFVYMLGYSISIGPLFMMYAVETLSNLQLIIQIYWGLMIVLTLTIDLLIEEVNIPIMFGIFFICSCACLRFFQKKMVETKGVPKKEIKSLIEKNEFVWESSEYIFSQSIKSETAVEKSLGTI